MQPPLHHQEMMRSTGRERRGDERSALHAVYRESTCSCSSAAIFQAEQQGQISVSNGEGGLRGRRGLKGERGKCPDIPFKAATNSR